MNDVIHWLTIVAGLSVLGLLSGLSLYVAAMTVNPVTYLLSIATGMMGFGAIAIFVAGCTDRVRMDGA